jgi:hypothetical protein
MKFSREAVSWVTTVAVAVVASLTVVQASTALAFNSPDLAPLDYVAVRSGAVDYGADAADAPALNPLDASLVAEALAEDEARARLDLDRRGLSLATSFPPATATPTSADLSQALPTEPLPSATSAEAAAPSQPTNAPGDQAGPTEAPPPTRTPEPTLRVEPTSTLPPTNTPPMTHTAQPTVAPPTDTPQPTDAPATRTAEPPAIVLPTETPTPTRTPLPTPTAQPTNVIEPSASPTPTDTPSRTNTPPPGPTHQPTGVPKSTAVAQPTQSRGGKGGHGDPGSGLPFPP